MHRIQRLLSVGDIAVYNRCHVEAGVKRYFTLDTRTDKIIGEFRTKKQAYKWATENSNLITA